MSQIKHGKDLRPGHTLLYKNNIYLLIDQYKKGSKSLQQNTHQNIFIRTCLDILLPVMYWTPQKIY